MGINIKSQEQYFIHVHEGISDPVSRVPLLPSKQITITKAPYAKSCTSVKWANKNWKYNKIWTKMLIQKHWFAESYNLYIISFMINVNKEQWCIVNESQPNDDVWHSYKIVIFTYTVRITWRDLFGIIFTLLSAVQTEILIKNALANYLYKTQWTWHDN